MANNPSSPFPLGHPLNPSLPPIETLGSIPKKVTDERNESSTAHAQKILQDRQGKISGKISTK